MQFTSLFGAEPISFSNARALEQSMPNLILYATPFMFFFVLLEYIVSRMQHQELYNNKETLASTVVGLGNVAIGVFLKTLLLYLFILVYNAIPWRMEFHWWTFLPCYIIFDFCSYWAHRISHHVRILWGTHVTHHSGNHYNLTVSFRLSWIQYVKIIFFLPVALIGFHPVIIFITNQVAVLFQFWVHTEYIKKLHFIIEYVFATPSNHRVHHGSQEKYINKNFGATFIIWDRIFRTYQKEEEKAVYGITHNEGPSYNPFYINFHEYIDIFNDVRKAETVAEKLFYIFGDPDQIAKFKKGQSEISAAKNKLSQINRVSA